MFVTVEICASKYIHIDWYNLSRVHVQNLLCTKYLIHLHLDHFIDGTVSYTMQYHSDRPVAYLPPAVQVWQEVNGFYRHNLAASSTANLDATASTSSTANLIAGDSSTASCDTGEKSKTRKRVRREAAWKSKKRIKLRNSGQAYTSVSNKQVSKNLLHKPDTVTRMQLHTYSAFTPLEFV